MTQRVHGRQESGRWGSASNGSQDRVAHEADWTTSSPWWERFEDVLGMVENECCPSRYAQSRFLLGAGGGGPKVQIESPTFAR